jgi:hypothetical protein
VVRCLCLGCAEGLGWKDTGSKEIKKEILARCQWLTLVILATIQEAEIRRIAVQSQPRQIVRETLSQKCPTQKKS